MSHRLLFMSTCITRAIGGWGLLLILTLLLPPPALAQQAVGAPTSLTISAMEPFVVGSTVFLEATLRDTGGLPLLGELITISINGKKVREDITDANGQVRFEIGNNWPIGDYAVQFESKASPTYAAARTLGQFTIRPIYLTITTVPPVPTAQFKIAGNTYVTDAAGRVRIEIPLPNTYQLEAILPPSVANSAEKQIEFNGWSDAATAPVRRLTIAQDQLLQAGFEFRYPVSTSVVSANNQPVPVDQLIVIASSGELITLNSAEVRFLPANAIQSANGTLVSEPITYVMAEASLNGQPVIENDSEPLVVTPQTQWQFIAPSYSLRLRAKANLFGSVADSAFELHYPDGQVEMLSLDVTGAVQRDNLLPGTYQAMLIGDLGNGTPITIDLMQSQDVLVTATSVSGIATVLWSLLILLLSVGVTIAALTYWQQRKKRRLKHPAMGRAPFEAAHPMMQESTPINRTVFYLPPTRQRGFNPFASANQRAMILRGAGLLVLLVAVYLLGQARLGSGQATSVTPVESPVSISAETDTIINNPPTPTTVTQSAPTQAPPLSSATPVASDGTAPQPAPQPANSATTNFTHIVRRGDTLTDLAKLYLGSGSQWRVIYNANLTVLGSPNNLQPGTVLVIPVP